MPVSKRTTQRILLILILHTAFFAADGQDATSNQSPVTGKQITLNVTVTDRDQRVITDLKAADFVVYDGGGPQQIMAATLSDIPACLGILLDNSGSMRHTIATVAQAVFNFVKAGNPANEMFLVNFNDDSYLDVEFTSDLERFREGLDRANARGGTALYSTIIAASDHLTKRKSCARRVLVVITDGADNSSRQTLSEAIDTLRRSGVTVYAIGLPYDKASGSAHPRGYQALKDLTLQSGGNALFIDNVKETDRALQKLAGQIRNQYSITYLQTGTNGKQKRVVKVNAAGRNDLKVRVVGE